MTRLFNVIAFILFAFSGANAQTVGDKITFTTKDGKPYEDVKLNRIYADSILIMHSGGMAKIPHEHLPDELAKKIGFDPEKAQAAREAQARMEAARRSRMAAQQSEKLANEAQLAKAELRDAFVYRVVDDGIIFQSIGAIKDTDGKRLALIVPGTVWGYKQILDGRNTNTEYFLEGVPETPALVDDQPFSAYMIPYGTYEFGSSRIRRFKFLKWGGILYEEDQKFNTPTVVRRVE